MTDLRPMEAPPGSRPEPASEWPRLRQIGTAAVWAVLALVVTIFAGGLVAGVALGASATPVVLLGWSAPAAEPILRGWGLPPGSVVAYVLTLETVAFGLGLVATWLLLHRPRSAWRVYVAVVVLLHVGVGGAAPLLIAAAVPGLSFVAAFTGLGWFGVFSLLLVFPDGRFVPRWTRWTLPAWVVVFVALLATDAAAPPPPVLSIALLILIVVGVAAQIHRYATVSDTHSRRQTRWVLTALLARAGAVVAIGIWRLLQPIDSGSASGLVIELAGLGASYLISSLLVLAIAVATVRHGLFGAEVAVSRAVQYVLLTIFVLVLYGLLVGVVGAFWPGGGALLPVAATAAAAVLLAPVRAWIQGRVAHLVYGERAEPYRVVRELRDRLAATTSPEEVVHAVVERIGPTFDLGRASITLSGQPAPVAVWAGAESNGRPESFPIEHQEHLVGTLTVVSRRGRSLSAADRELLHGLAGQAGLAVAAAQATAEVQLARDRVVAAREEERRRLHRDLHDGLGPTLAGIYQRVDLAGRLVPTDPQTARRLLDETGRQVKEAVADVRRVVYALRPPQLDDLGLVEAVRAAAADLTAGGTAVEVRGDVDSALPAVTESTAYRIALEAMTNCVRHAQAGSCRVDITDRDERALLVTVTDDGVGRSGRWAGGAGLRSMRERAAEAGGRLDVEFPAAGGVRVRARLPLSLPLSSAAEPELS